MGIAAVIAAVLLAQSGSTGKVRQPGLLVLLEKMAAADQSLRMKFADAMRAGRKLEPSDVRALERVDHENTGHMRQIVRTYGWPTRDLVGDKGANLAWLLVQHADHSPAFQRECLDLMTPLLGQGGVRKQDYALLTDRVLLAEGKKQRYGSQFFQRPDGRWMPKPIEDPENVDKRRAEMGLQPLAEYRKALEELYGAKPPPA